MYQDVLKIACDFDKSGSLSLVPVKNQSPRQRIDGTSALLDVYCYVGPILPELMFLRDIKKIYRFLRSCLKHVLKTQIIF